MPTVAADVWTKHASPFDRPLAHDVEYALLVEARALRRVGARGSSLLPAPRRRGWDVTIPGLRQRRLDSCFWAIALTIALTVGWGASVRADPITDDNVAEAVSAAKTASDHQALAAYFTAKADAATAKAGMHQRMAAAFGGKGRETSQMHCKALVRASKRQAQDYTALAKEQEKLAEGK